MENLQRVLIGNDSLAGMEAALEKAALIEHYSGAELTAAEVIYDPIADEPGDRLQEAERAQLIEALKAAERQGLANLVTPLEARVASIEARVVWHRNAAQGLLELQHECGAQLLIKPISKHGRITDYLHTPLDWTLMREAPCAVLVSRQGGWTTGGHVLAAVDVADAKHSDLNEAVLGTAATFARLLDATLHIASAYPELGQSVSDLQVAMDYEGIKQDMHDTRTAKLAEWCTALSWPDAVCHVIEGKPAAVIARLGDELPATVTVVGTAARKGLGKLLLGNTSEAIIHQASGDLVVVRGGE